MFEGSERGDWDSNPLFLTKSDLNSSKNFLGRGGQRERELLAEENERMRKRVRKRDRERCRSVSPARDDCEPFKYGKRRFCSSLHRQGEPRRPYIKIDERTEGDLLSFHF